MLKYPRIFKSGQYWILQYRYPPRMMWLFGLDSQERQLIKDLCIKVINCTSFEDAILKLKNLYTQGEIQT